jgi:hypothetical protein
MMSSRVSRLVHLVALSLLLTASLSAVSVAQVNSSPVAAPVHPALSFSSYLLSPADRVNAVATGRDGSVYVAGVTLPRATDVDATRPSAGEGNAFVAKFSPDGSKLIYFTYLSTSGLDEARALAVDPDGNAYIAGKTRATNFAVVQPVQASCKANGAGACAGTAFIAKVNAGGQVAFATYLGGSGGDEANAVAVDSRGNMFVAGSTRSLDFPVTNAAQQAAGGNGDAFVAAISAHGTRLLFATYLGGSDADEARALTLDNAGNLYITGKTNSLDFPVSNALQPQCATAAKGACQESAFVTKLSANGANIRYSTYLGGSSGDAGNAIAVDAKGQVYVAGVTKSADFPTTLAGQTALKGESNAFISKLSAKGSGLMFSTYLGGSTADQANAVALDRSGNIVVGGWTHSADFPLQTALQAGCNPDKTGGCSYDAFLATLTPNGSHLRFSTYLGGSGTDVLRALSVDTQGSAYLGGWTASRDFPQAKMPDAPANVVAPASRKAGGAFLAKITGLNDDGPSVTCGAGTKAFTNGAGDDQWGTAGNWNPNGVPGSADNACIPSSFTGTVTVGGLAAANQTIASLNSGANISFTSGPLTVTGTATFAADLTQTGGSLVLSSTSTMNTLHMNGGVLSGAGNISISGLTTWQGGSICTQYTSGACPAPASPSSVTANGGVSFTGSSALQGRTLNNPGTATFTQGANITLYNSASFTNPSGATLDFGHDGSMFTSGSGNLLTNGGTIQKTVGAGNSYIDPPFNNTGSITESSGTMLIRTGGTFSGAVRVNTGGNLQFPSGAFNWTGPIINNGGTLLFNGADIDFTGAAETITGPANMTAGVLYGPATLTITGLFTWQNGSICTTFTSGSCPAPATQSVVNMNGGVTFTGSSNLAGSTLNNPGKATFSQGAVINLYSAAVFNNPSTGTLDLSNDGSVFNPGAGSLANAGAIVKTSGSSNSYIDPPITNTGSVTESSGTMLIRGGGTFGGSLTINTGGNVYFPSNTFTWTGSITNNGGGLFFNGADIDFTSSTQTITGPATLAAGVVYGPAKLTITGLLTWQNGSICTTFTSGSCPAPATQSVVNANGGISFTGSSYLQGRTLNNPAMATFSQGAVIYLYAASIVNNTGTLDFSHDGSLFINGAGNTVNNGGRLQKTSGTSNSYIDAAFNNSGGVFANSGTVLFRGVYTQTKGTTELSGGGALQFTNGTATFSGGTFTGNGTVTGNLSNTGANFQGGTDTTTGVVAVTGTYNQAAAGVFTAKISGAACTPNDEFTFTGAATLTGPLEVATVNGCTPAAGAQFTVMTFASKTGTFSSITHGWTVSYTATSVVATYTAGTPAVTLTPSSLNFGTQIIGTLTVKKITVKDSGGDGLYINNISISGDYTQSNNCIGIVINANGTCTITVTFKPTAMDSRPGTITISDNAGTGTQTVNLAGVGTYLKVTPSSVAFPAQLLNTASSPVTITLQNTNPGSTLTISGISFSGGNASDFSENKVCDSAVIAAGGGTCSFTVTMTPSALGKRTTTMKIAENGGGSPILIAIIGYGTYVTLAPSPLAFGTVTVGNSSTLTVTLTNNNPTTAVAVSAATIGGTNKADFSASLDPSCSSVAANGGTCPIHVTFKPKAHGARGGILDVKDNDPGSPQSDILGGTGQ